MFNYTQTQWLFFFYFYCFFGWIFESTFVSVRKKHFVNRGFMRGPFLPLYGSGAIMMLVVSRPFSNNIVLTYLAGCIGATVLELITGMLMEGLFKVRYWDYSNQKFNYKGHICLSSTVAWGFLTILMTQFCQKFVEKIAFAIPTTIMSILTYTITAVIIADFTLSFKAALDLRDILIALEKARTEMEHIQKRLDVLVAVANHEIATKKQSGSLKIEELMDSIEERFGKLREYIKVSPSELLEDAKDEIMELRTKYFVEKEHRVQSKSIKDFFELDMIKGNPNMQSKRFAEALEELKKAVTEHKKN